MTEADGVLERHGDVSVLRFRRTLAQPLETVWAALTEDVHLKEWFPTTIEGAQAAGAPLHYAFRQGEGEAFDGQMTAFEPPSLMELRWADDLLRFELESDGSGCILSLTVTFPEHGKAARDATGWHVCLERLALECSGAALPWSPPDRWHVVHPYYVAAFGAEASAIGPPPGRGGVADDPPSRR
jgi:uncharacterized protein YndB with AHSA1/START domain